jgi:hypothetical protein
MFCLHACCTHGAAVGDGAQATLRGVVGQQEEIIMVSLLYYQYTLSNMQCPQHILQHGSAQGLLGSAMPAVALKFLCVGFCS